MNIQKLYILVLTGLLFTVVGCGSDSSPVSDANDTTAPEVSAPAAVTAEASSAAGHTVTFSGCTATDDTDSTLEISYSHSSGDMFPIGTTTVICTATDDADNSNSGSFDVTVADTIAPTLTTPSNITVEAESPSGSTVNYVDCSASDVVDDSLTISYSQASGTTFPMGTTIVTCSATDDSGNEGSATFDITVNAYTLLDTTNFNSPNGYVIHDAAGGASNNEEGFGLAIDASGNIIVAGDGSSGSYGEAVIWRYQSDGTLDSAFDSDGIIVAYQDPTPFSSHQSGRDVAIDGSGNVVVAGMAQNNSTGLDPAVWRYDSDGALDTSFDTDGFVSYDIGAPYQHEYVKNMTIDASGRILLVADGWNSTSSSQDILVWRLSSDGSLDTTFCGTGYCTFSSSDLGPLSNESGAGFDIITDGNVDGKILVTGNVSASSTYYTDMFVLRLNNDGSMDTGFDSDGVVTFNGPGGQFDGGEALKLDGDDKIVVTGFTRSTTWGDDIIVWRFNSDGSLDTGFDSDGYAIVNNNNRDRGTDLVITSGGQILVTGKLNRGTGGGDSEADVAVLRFNANGSLDTTFDSDGIYLLEISGGSAIDYSGKWGGIAIDADGKPVVTGASYNGSNYDMTIWRLKN